MEARGDWGVEGAMTGADRKGQSENLAPRWTSESQLSPKTPKARRRQLQELSQPLPTNNSRNVVAAIQIQLLLPAELKMSSSTPPNKRIHISSSFTTDAEHLREQIHDNKTGETKTITHDTPHESSHTTTITTNPYTVETNGAEQKTKQGDSVTLDLDPSHCPATVGYDTSQL